MDVERRYYSEHGNVSGGVFVKRNMSNKKRVDGIIERIVILDKLGEIYSVCSGDGRIYFLGGRGDCNVPVVERRFGFQPALIARAGSHKELRRVADKFNLRL